MNHERMSALARNAAVAMLDKSLSYEERAKITNPKEVDELPESEFIEYRNMMIAFMRELSKQKAQEGSHD